MTTKKSDIVIISEGQPLVQQKPADTTDTNAQSNPEKYVRAFAVVGESPTDRAGVYVNKQELEAWREKNRRESTSGSN